MKIGGDRPPNLDHLFGLNCDLTPDTARVICKRCNTLKSNCTDPEVFGKIADFYARPLRAILEDARANEKRHPMPNWIDGLGEGYYGCDPRRFLMHRRFGAAKAAKVHEVDTFVPADIAWPDRCPILGLKFDYSFKENHDATPSPDRIDSRRGYVRDNVLVVSWLANRLKRNATPWELELVAEWMAAEYATSLSDRHLIMPVGSPPVP
ncbi:hypothetical protein [Roseinatronobacter sp. S2]|uniref:hypothetical protein n=1 Tax=Roseinatronobacter sp. S2 TaxID=3035471 RepID=UPI002410B53E|nr:hypothetical protein [Roseinatronobacter sp. S2]WFE74255.1 hypothetical protein P8S53_13845 [Roseinatronobacter sp. S2]